MTGLRTGDRVTITVGPVAHGGHCVARHEGQVMFVRHALPGEQVVALVTGVGSGGRFVRADAVAVLRASPDRTAPPCPYAHPGGCGGCDFQHVTVPAQRALKTAVLVEQLTRLAGLTQVGGRPVDEAVTVVAVPGDQDGLRWRTRVGYAVAEDGRLGLRRHRSHEVEPVQDCRIATDAVVGTGVTARRWPGFDTVEVVGAGSGDRLVHLEPPPPASGSRAGRDVLAGLPADVAVSGVRGRRWVGEQAAGRSWRVDGAGFWQVHPGAAQVLVDTVRELLAPRAGEHLLDLYCGVGLFAGALAPELGEQGRVDAVESGAAALRDARRNLHDLATVRLHLASVDRWLAGPAPPRADLVVLDPPRSGAGTAVVRAVLARRPRAVAYVACDPAALARDLRAALDLGWQVDAVRGLDLFPMTHHLEAVALLRPTRGGGRPDAEVS